MTIKDLKFKEDAISESTLKDEHRFIYQYGLFNCKILKLKSANEVLKSVESYDPENKLSKEQKEFILKNSNKEVLCYLCHSWEDNPDIFIYGENNIAFQVDCFV